MPKKVKPFTVVEDFYLTGNVGVKSVQVLAADLERTQAEVVTRCGELKLDLAKAAYEQVTKGFDVHHSGVVSMTGRRSLADDRAAGRLPEELGGKPKAENKEFLGKHQKNIHRIFPTA